MGKRIVKKDRGYGCFVAGFNCLECGKTVLIKEFSWGTNMIGLGDEEKIVEALNNTALEKEINFCCKCGADLN